MATDNKNLLSTPLHGIYIPATLLVVGTAIVNRDWIPYAVGVALVLSGFKVYRGQPTKVLKKDQFQEFELQEKTVLSHNVAIYKFKLPQQNNILGLPIGQHVSLCAHIDGKDVVRSYTPVSSDNDRGFFSLLIKTYPTGNISRYVANMKIGQTIKVRGPKGQFVYTPNMCRAFGMIAGGTGITPMLQIIRAVCNNPEDKTQIDLIFANVNEEDILLKEDLDELAKEHANFRVHYVLNNPPEGWTGGVGFVTPDMVKQWCPAPAPDVKILLCGPPPMVSALKKATSALGYEPAKPVSKLEHQVFSF
ncbi:ferredoxin reductase-like protein [Ascodesmis nigricans]|uniref:NADH-cytochrome b5 reductase n=1 Tax=Ascodesmis nigricans TaxID=341454 RepID=A0A4S2N7X7_9PEZI|nr:ferredoxin reductase-like protein [Ascodesmis nigricans]